MEDLANLDWEEIRNRLGQMATSALAREALLNLSPAANPEAAQLISREIAEAQAILSLGRRPHAESLDLYQVWHVRLSKEAVLKTLELKDVRLFCLEIIALKEVLRATQGPWLKLQRDSLMDADEPLSAIDQLMTAEGEIRTDASETLYRLFHERQAQVRQVQNILDRLVKDHELASVLQERYVTTREGRWVLPVKSGMRHDFEGIIHGSSQTKQTVFMEPKEIIPLNNRLRELDVLIEEEVDRLLASLSSYLRSRLGEFATAKGILLLLDERLAQAQLTTQLDAHPAVFDDTKFELHELRHPLLALGKEKVISNSFVLTPERRILLLSGPNAGGKTVLLKSVGLAVQMARCGLPIAAGVNSRLPFFNRLIVSVGDAQSVDAHLSTFAAHLKILQQAAEAKGLATLLLIDEICGSTDPEEGSALARAFIETFASRSVFGVITSHLGPLKLGWSSDSGVINGSMEYDTQSGRPSYQFIMGVPGQSLAIKTAKRVGIASPIVDRAMELLSPETKRFLSGLEEVEQIKSELRQAKEQAQAAEAQAKAKDLKLSQELARLERERDQLLDKTLKDAGKKIESLIESAKVADTFRRHENLEKMRAELPEMVKASSSSSRAPLSTAEDFAKAYPPGSKVFAQTIGRDALVQGPPNAKGEILILSNSMRLMVPWTSLKPAQQATNPTFDILRHSRNGGSGVADADRDREIDLRGMKVEEALEQLDLQLDTAMRQAEERVKVIHGHGTDTLKRAVRTFLSRSVYVKKWQAGNADTGGDGITWVELNDEVR